MAIFTEHYVLSKSWPVCTYAYLLPHFLFLPKSRLKHTVHKMRADQKAVTVLEGERKCVAEVESHSDPDILSHDPFS